MDRVRVTLETESGRTCKHILAMYVGVDTDTQKTTWQSYDDRSVIFRYFASSHTKKRKSAKISRSNDIYFACFAIFSRCYFAFALASCRNSLRRFVALLLFLVGVFFVISGTPNGNYEMSHITSETGSFSKTYWRILGYQARCINRLTFQLFPQNPFLITSMSDLINRCASHVYIDSKTVFSTILGCNVLLS